MTALLDAATGTPDLFRAPLYTVTEAARYLAVPPSTLDRWAHGYTKHRRLAPDVTGEPILTTVVRIGGVRAPVIPFVGLAEGLVLTALRHHGLPLQRIRPAIARLEREFGLGHALASRRLFTDGAEVLHDYADEADEQTARAVRELVVVRSGQHVFTESVTDYLKLLTFGDDDYARLIRLPGYRVAEVVVDPTRAFGQPIFARGGARLEDALSMFRAGETLENVADEYRIPAAQLEDAVRVATLIAA